MPVSLPQGPPGYSQRDQDLTRRIIELTFNATPEGAGAGGSGFSPIITGAATGDTIYYDGASWRNSALLRNTGTITGGVTMGSSNVYGHVGTGKYVHVWEDTTLGLFSLCLVSTDAVRWPYIWVLGEGTGGGEFAVSAYGANPGDGAYWTSTRLRGTRSAPDYVQAGDLIAQYMYRSYKGSGSAPEDWATGALHDIRATATWTATSRPTSFDWWTTPVGSVTPVKRLTIGSDGFVTHTATDLVQLGTITALQQVRDDSVTWNAGGVVFTGWKLNVTNTASAAGSLLADLQVGGSYKFKVDKDGKSWQVGTNIVQLGTITADQQTQTQEVTWNNAGVLFVADYMNVVPTAYANGSKMLDYRVNGTSRFTILLSTTFSQAFVNITPPDNQVAIQIGGSRTGTGGERIVNIAPTVNTTGSPILVDILATHVAAGASTQLFRVGRSDNGTMFNITYSGNVGIAGGSDANVWCRIGPGGSQIDVSGGLQVNPTLTNNGALSHKVLEVLGAGLAGTYTTPVVTSMYVGTYSKAASQTITTWYGLDILAGPVAGTKWSIRAAENVWIKGNLTVDGTITGFTGIGAHTHAETDITDGSLLARVAANESITGAWTFAPSTTATAIAVTQAVGAKGIVVAGGTQTTSQPVLDLAQTWNAGAVAFHAATINVTHTAAGLSSTIFRLQRGGTSFFEIYGDRALQFEGDSTIFATKFNFSGSVTAPSGVAQAMQVATTLIAAGNNDLLHGLVVAPSLTPGSYTGLDARALFVQTNGGTMTGTKYGLYIGAQSGATTNYAIWSAGGKNYFVDAVNTNDQYQVDETKVVGNRITGYTAMTGTADKATAYATSTITLQQLAERVKSIQDDLTTHGLIGA